MTDTAARSIATEAPRTRRARPPLGLVASVAALGIFSIAAFAPSVLATHDPLALDYAQALTPPSSDHWFGTDESGRDLYSRVVFGTRESLAIGLGATGLGLVLAILLGSAAAMGVRPVSRTVDRVIEILFAFPTLLLALLLVTILGSSPATVIIAVGVGSAPGYARMVRGQILASKSSGYVEAARALGHSGGLIFRQHILPNAFRPLIALFTMSVGQSIVWASAMAFIGLGVAPPSSEWGALLDAGRSYITQAGWLIVIPGLVIAALALTATTLGKYIQQHFEKGTS